MKNYRYAPKESGFAKAGRIIDFPGFFLIFRWRRCSSDGEYLQKIWKKVSYRCGLQFTIDNGNSQSMTAESGCCRRSFFCNT